MKKTIILSNGVKKEMTYEEVLKHFNRMINKAANIAISKFNSIEREDMIQEMKLETWKAFEEYDEKHAFSTFLTFKLKKVTGNEAQKITAQKRTSYGVVSMNATLGDSEDLTYEDMFKQDEVDFTYGGIVGEEIMQVIEEHTDNREKEELLCILYPHEFNSTVLAEMRGISRQAANQRVRKTKEKLQSLLLMRGLAI